MINIANQQTITFFKTEEKANALAANLLADDADTDYRVVEGSRGYFVAIFEDGKQVFTL